MKDKESFFIKQFNSSKIGDDGAILNSSLLASHSSLIVSSDSFFEEVHFKRGWLSLFEIAKKAMLINISDAIVMNAKPKQAILNVAIPKNFSKKDLIELANGFKAIASEFGVEIIGGDTISNKKLDISITLLSYSKKPIKRNGTKINQIVCYTDDLGSVKKDLKKLFANKKISKNSKFITPKLKSKFFYEIARYTSSAIDISDGLFFELERLSNVNKIGFKFFKKISSEIGCSGEEYEILFTFDKEYLAIIKNIAKKHKVKLNFIAKTIRGSYKCPCKPHHF